MKKMGRPSLSETPSKQATFRLSEDELKLFNEKLGRHGYSKSQILRELVTKWLEE